jgi:hypothetical protein
MSRSLIGAVALLALLPALAHGHFRMGFYPAPAVVASYPGAVPVYAMAPPQVVFSAYPVYAAPPAPLCLPAFAGPLAQTEPPPVSAPTSTPPTYAPPTAAPPSGSPAAPPMPPADSPSSTLMTRAAKVSESSLYDVYPVAARGAARPAGDRYPVCFWNLTGHDVTLKVAGRTEVVPAGSRARLDLERRFSWQADGREPHSQDAPAGADGLEIVLRR